jgi:hypothetical protein
MVLITEAATDDPTTDEAAIDEFPPTIEEAAMDELPATTDEFPATTDEPAMVLPAILLPARVLAFTLAFNVLLRVSVRENVLFVHWNRIILLLLSSATSKKTPGKSEA